MDLVAHRGPRAPENAPRARLVARTRAIGPEGGTAKAGWRRMSETIYRVLEFLALAGILCLCWRAFFDSGRED